MSVLSTRIGSDYEFESPNEDWYQQLELIYAYDFLSNEECETFLDLKEVLGSEQEISTGIPIHQMGEKVSWLSARIQTAIADFNFDFWRFDLLGLDGINLMTFNNSNKLNSFHHGRMWNDGLMKKLTVIIQLSDPMTYQDGETLVIDGQASVPIKKARGSINVFPSFLHHVINPVTNGTRDCLVTWVVGPPFK